MPRGVYQRSPEQIEAMRRVAKASADIRRQEMLKRMENPEELARIKRMNIGRKHSEEFKEKQRIAHLGLKPNDQGKNQPCPYTPGNNVKLHEDIRSRDGQICQMCGMTQEEHLQNFQESLHVHHIDGSFDNHSVYNLITLCQCCHREVHKDLIEEYREYLKLEVEMTYFILDSITIK